MLRTCVRCKDATPGDQPAAVLAPDASVRRLLASDGKERARLGPPGTAVGRRAKADRASQVRVDATDGALQRTRDWFGYM